MTRMALRHALFRYEALAKCRSKRIAHIAGYFVANLMATAGFARKISNERLTIVRELELSFAAALAERSAPIVARLTLTRRRHCNAYSWPPRLRSLTRGFKQGCAGPPVHKHKAIRPVQPRHCICICIFGIIAIFDAFHTRRTRGHHVFAALPPCDDDAAVYGPRFSWPETHSRRERTVRFPRVHYHIAAVSVWGNRVLVLAGLFAVQDGRSSNEGNEGSIVAFFHKVVHIAEHGLYWQQHITTLLVSGSTPWKR